MLLLATARSRADVVHCLQIAFIVEILCQVHLGRHMGARKLYFLGSLSYAEAKECGEPSVSFI